MSGILWRKYCSARMVGLVACISDSVISAVQYWINDVASVSVSRLNHMIRHYEPVHYDRDAFHENHMRARRSTTESNNLHVTAFGRCASCTETNVLSFETRDVTFQRWTQVLFISDVLF